MEKILVVAQIGALLITPLQFYPSPLGSSRTLKENILGENLEPPSTMRIEPLLAIREPKLQEIMVGSSRNTEELVLSDRIKLASISAQNGSKFDVKALAEELVTQRFGEGEFESLSQIISHESSWRVNATEPSTGAYGLGQALPPSKMATYGTDWHDNPETQLKWMIEYIAQRYGTPNQAWIFWQQHHWY